MVLVMLRWHEGHCNGARCENARRMDHPRRAFTAASAPSSPSAFASASTLCSGLNASRGLSDCGLLRSDKAPCACVADGVAMPRSPARQRTLEIATEKLLPVQWPSSSSATSKPVRAAKYSVADSWLASGRLNRTLDYPRPIRAVMKAEHLFDVTP